MEFLSAAIDTSNFSPRKISTPLIKVLTQNTPTLTHNSLVTKRGSLENVNLLNKKENNTSDFQNNHYITLEEPKSIVKKVKPKGNTISYRKASSGGLTPFSVTRSTVFTPKSSSNQESRSFLRDNLKRVTKGPQPKTTKEKKETIISRGSNVKRSSLSKIHKKNLLDFSSSSEYSEKLQKSRNSKQKEILDTLPEGENGDSDSFEEKLTLASVMRRRSCHCSDCGHISKLEKKHVNINIPCKRVQDRKNKVFLSLRSDWSTPFTNAQRPSTDITPITRVTRPSLDYSPLLNSPASSISSSKKFLAVAFSWDKAPSHLSKFASNKRSFTMHTEPNGEIRGMIGKIGSSKLIEDDAEGDEDRPGKSAKSTTVLKSKIPISRNSVDGQFPSGRRLSSIGKLTEKLMRRGLSMKLTAKGMTASSIESSEEDALNNSAIEEEKISPAFPSTDSKLKGKNAWKMKNLTLDTKYPHFRKLSYAKTQESPKKEGNYHSKEFRLTQKSAKVNAKLKKKSIIETYTTLSPSKPSSSHSNKMALSTSKSITLKEPNSSTTVINNPSIGLLSPNKNIKPIQSLNSLLSARGNFASLPNINLPTINSSSKIPKNTKRSPKKKNLNYKADKLQSQTDGFVEMRKTRDQRVAVKTERDIAMVNTSPSEKKITKRIHKKNVPSLVLPEELKKVYKHMSTKGSLTPNKSFKEI